MAFRLGPGAGSFWILLDPFALPDAGGQMLSDVSSEHVLQSSRADARCCLDLFLGFSSLFISCSSLLPVSCLLRFFPAFLRQRFSSGWRTNEPRANGTFWGSRFSSCEELNQNSEHLLKASAAQQQLDGLYLCVSSAELIYCPGDGLRIGAPGSFDTEILSSLIFFLF